MRKYSVPTAGATFSNTDLFIDTYKSDKIKISVNEMTVNDSEMYVR